MIPVNTSSHKCSELVSFQRAYDRFTEETVNKASTLIEIFDNQDKCQLREELMFGFDLQLVHTFPVCVLIIRFCDNKL